MSTLEGKLVANNMKVGIVVARFNEFITNKLLGGAMDGLLRHDVKEEDITVAWVPGAFEIPLIAKKMAMSTKFRIRHCVNPNILGLCLRKSPEATTSHYHKGHQKNLINLLFIPLFYLMLLHLSRLILF